MAKLFGHLFDFYKGGFSVFEVEKVRETPGQFIKTDFDNTKTPDYWRVLKKKDLGKLRPVSPYGFKLGEYVMYSMKEQLEQFRDLVIKELQSETEKAAVKYASFASLLDSAGGHNGELIKEYARAIYAGALGWGAMMNLKNKDFLTLTEEEFDKTIDGLDGLSLIIAPFLLKANHEGKGIDDAAEATLDLMIGADAVREIKAQIFGEREAE